MKKTFFTLCLMALLGGTTHAQEITQTITINGETVEQTAVQLAFSGDNVTLTYADRTTQTADMATVSITFNTSTGIGAISAFEYRGLVDGQMNISGLNAGTQVCVYDNAGRQLFSQQATGSSMQMDATTLAPGVYVLRVGQQTVKFLKK